MITNKHAYLNLLTMGYEIKSIIEAIESNRSIQAYRMLLELEKRRNELIKPLYSTLTQKQKDELLDGWDPDTSEGSYITVPDPKGWKKAWDKK